MIVASILTPLEDLLRHILNALHSVGLPWAWSIVGLTIIVRMLLVPLTVKQIHSMQNMQAHAPQMKEIQRKYKGDRTKLNEELMKFYKENNINPAASCLPLLAQLPIFIGLFYTLRALREEPAGRPGRNRPRRLLVAAFRARHHQAREQPLVGLHPAHDLRAQPGGLDVLHVRDDAEVAALPDDDLADRLHPVHRALSDRARSLLDDDEPLDGRAGADHPPADSQGRLAGRAFTVRAETVVAHSAEGAADPTVEEPAAEAPAPKPSNAQPRRVKRKKKARR